jgi:hypothetical protein
VLACRPHLPLGLDTELHLLPPATTTYSSFDRLWHVLHQWFSRPCFNRHSARSPSGCMHLRRASPTSSLSSSSPM